MSKQLPFQLWRQDDNGHRFLVASFAHLAEAEELQAKLSAGGHKQIWWIETLQTSEVDNLFDNIPEALPVEIFTTLLQRPGIKLERIVSRGHDTPEGQWYNQSNDEWIMILSGQAVLVLEDPEERIILEAGHHIMIPAFRRHRVESTAQGQETIWLGLHLQAESKPDRLKTDD